MMKHGLQDEVQSLLPYKNLSALQTVGYKEMFQFFENSITLPEAIRLIKSNTKKYAKRQMTWFKKDKSIEWISNDEFAYFIAYLSSFMGK